MKEQSSHRQDPIHHQNGASATGHADATETTGRPASSGSPSPSTKQPDRDIAQAHENSSRVLKRYFIDSGSYIGFPNSVAYSHFPAGIYYPASEDRTGRFILRRIDPLNKKATEDMIREEDNDQLARELDALLSDDDEPEEVTKSDIGRMMKRIESSSFLSEGYFPMEKWNPGLESVDRSIRTFLKNRELYERNSLGFRRSILLFGEPGTGKSRYIDHVSKQLIEENDAVVIRLDSRREIGMTIEKGLITLEAYLGDRLKVFIIEELAQISSRMDITELLNFLDNAVLRHNVLFLMTTNTPERIPKPLIDRPSRIDVLEKVGANNRDGFIEAWYTHITGKTLPESSKDEPWYDARLSPAYLKELFLVSMLNEQTPEQAWKDLSRRKHLVAASFDDRDRSDFIL